ncbi:hypothetical protein H5410_046011 [Solanum commersonii]|uniref:Uncharacterized protein n=1 Tax=Solanum commersonii TaxID=4109 RepID=A0A9J5XB43_SOLCO|nr:hypothetical protein H5410_046011 [Solanum commersonii]
MLKNKNVVLQLIATEKCNSNICLQDQSGEVTWYTRDLRQWYQLFGAQPAQIGVDTAQAHDFFIALSSKKNHRRSSTSVEEEADQLELASKEKTFHF